MEGPASLREAPLCREARRVSLDGEHGVISWKIKANQPALPYFFCLDRTQLCRTPLL